jgi:hypothetical protein
MINKMVDEGRNGSNTLAYCDTNKREPKLKYACYLPILWPGKSYWGGRFSTIDLLVDEAKKGSKFFKNMIFEKTCFQNRSKFITEDHFVQHMNITTNERLIKWKLYAKDN